MTSQNNTLRCAASTIYSMAGPNTPSGAVNAPTEDGCAWLDGIGSAPACCSAGARRALRLSCALVRARRHQNPPQVRQPSFPGRMRERHGASCEAIHHIRDRCVLTSVKFAARPAAASSVLIAIPYWATRDPNGSTPLQRHADISGQPSGILDDFDPELVSARTEVLRPKDIDLLWHAGQRVFPPRLLLNDGAALVRAQLVRKTVHLYLGAAVAYRALDDLDRAPNALFIGNSRWLREVIEQCLFLGLGRRPLGRFFGGLFRLGQGKFLHEILCRGQQLVGFGRHVLLQQARSSTLQENVNLHLSRRWSLVYIYTSTKGST